MYTFGWQIDASAGRGEEAHGDGLGVTGHICLENPSAKNVSQVQIFRQARRGVGDISTHLSPAIVCVLVWHPAALIVLFPIARARLGQ